MVTKSTFFLFLGFIQYYASYIFGLYISYLNHKDVLTWYSGQEFLRHVPARTYDAIIVDAFDPLSMYHFSCSDLSSIPHVVCVPIIKGLSKLIDNYN